MTAGDVAEARVDERDDGRPSVSVRVELYSAGRARFVTGGY